MGTRDERMSKEPSVVSPAGQGTPPPIQFAFDAGDGMTAWPDYMVDAFQRSILFLDLLRQRGDEEIEITSRPMATVLSFGHDVLMDGRSLPRPINYTLRVSFRRRASRPIRGNGRSWWSILAPARGRASAGSRPRARSAMPSNAGHPVYFIGFGAMPAPGQQFLDVVEGQVRFFERVVELHPDAPRPFAIGNCQAGYQTLMVAILRPDLFGPCLGRGLADVVLAGRARKEPDALFRRLARR